MSALLDFWSELRKRHVVRAAVAYGVASWLVLQVLDTAGEVVGFPAWTLRFVLTVLALGFPFVLVAAWIFEVTPEGVRRESELGDAPRDPRIGRRFDFVIVVLLLAALGMLGYDWLRGGRPIAVAANVDKSIAVLPFTAFSSDEEEQYFADGLADTLLHRLAQLRDVRVIARSSSFRYRGDAVDVRQVGQELGVATVLEGSIQRSGERLRIISQLVRTDDGSQIWSRTFDRDRADLFEIQDEIARAVVTSLSLSLSGDERDRLAATETESLEAYDLSVRAQERFRNIDLFGTDQDELLLQVVPILAMLEQALELDPGYAAAYRVRGDTYAGLAFAAAANAKRRDAFVSLGMEAIRQALLLDPDDPRSFSVLGELLRRRGEAGLAEVMLRRALATLPNDPTIHSRLGLALTEQGKYEEAEVHYQRSEALDPAAARTPFAWRRRAIRFFTMGREEDALAELLGNIGISDREALLVGDLTAVQSHLLGRHVETVRSLLRVAERSESASELRLRVAFARILKSTGRLDAIPKVLGSPGEDQTVFQDASTTGDDPIATAETQIMLARRIDPRSPERAAYLCAGRNDAPCVREALEPMFPELSLQLDEVVVQLDQLDEALQLGLAYRALGDEGRANRLARAVTRVLDRLPPDSSSRRYFWRDLAARSLSGDVEGALVEFRRGVELPGGAYRPVLSFDHLMFDAIRDDPEFAELVAEYRRREAAAGQEVVALLEEAGIL